MNHWDAICRGRGLHMPAIVLLLATFARPLAAAPPLGEAFLFDAYRQGLPQISVHAVAQGPRGYLWVGTEEGLVSFDGRRFEVLDRAQTPELRSHFIQALLPGGDGSETLWIGTHRGFGSLRHHRLELYTTAEGLVHDEVHILHRSSGGDLWIGTAGGLSRFDGESFVNITKAKGLAGDLVYALAETPDGTLWAGTDMGLTRLEPDRPGAEPASFGTDDGLSHPTVYALATDRRGVLWIGTVNGLDRFTDGRLEPYLPGADLPHPSVRSLFVDTADTLWIGTEKGLGRLEAGRGDPVIFQEDLAEEWVSSFGEDAEGLLWIGTRFGGLTRLRRARVRTFDERVGLVNDLVWGVYEDRSGNVWIATDGGLTRLGVDGAVTSYDEADGLPDPASGALYEDEHGVLWIGTFEHGLVRFQDGRFRVYTPADGFPPVRVRRILPDGPSRLAIASNGGLILFDGEVFEVFRDGLPHEHIRDAVVDPAGGFWLATEGGLAHFRDGRFTHHRMPAANVSPPLGSPRGDNVPEDGDERVKSIYRDADGVLWLGTWERGLARFDRGSWTFISVAEGLHHHRIHRIEEDDAGWLWMSSHRGIFRVLKSELDDFAAGRIARVTSIAFSEHDGLRSLEFNGGSQPAGVLARDGRLWMGGIAGVAVVDTKDLATNTVPPPVHVEEVLADDRVIRPPFADTEFPPGVRELRIRFAALSFLDPSKVRLRYRLEGFDSSWREASQERGVSYTNLQPGDYRFRVIAGNNDGVWNDVGDSFVFRLRPAFYQTWFFYGAAALAVAWMLRGLHQLRVRRLLQKELRQERFEMLEAAHAEMERFTYAVSHDLKSPVATLGSLLSLLRYDLENGHDEQVHDYLQTMDTAVDQMTSQIDGLMEVARSGRVVREIEDIDLDELTREAVGLVSARIAKRGVEVVIAPDLPTIAGDRSRLLQVLQNLIDNAVKFMGDQRRPRIEIGVDTNGTAESYVYVRDNGRGIEPIDQDKVFGLFDRLDPETEGTGIGLALVQRIVEVHGGRVWVESAGRSRGSTFCFTIRAA